MMGEREILHLLRLICRRLDTIESKLDNDADLLTIGQVSEMLGRTKNAIRQMVHRGQIDAEHAPNGQLRFRRGHVKAMQNATA